MEPTSIEELKILMQEAFRSGKFKPDSLPPDVIQAFETINNYLTKQQERLK